MKIRKKHLDILQFMTTKARRAPKHTYPPITRPRVVLCCHVVQSFDTASPPSLLHLLSAGLWWLFSRFFRCYLLEDILKNYLKPNNLNLNFCLDVPLNISENIWYALLLRLVLIPLPRYNLRSSHTG